MPDEALFHTVCQCVLDIAHALKPEYRDILQRVEIEEASLREAAAALALRRAMLRYACTALAMPSARRSCTCVGPVRSTAAWTVRVAVLHRHRHLPEETTGSARHAGAVSLDLHYRDLSVLLTAPAGACCKTTPACTSAHVRYRSPATAWQSAIDEQRRESLCRTQCAA